VRHEMHDSFHFPLFHCSTCNSPTEGRTTSSTVLHHAATSRCPPQYPMAPTSTMVWCHLNWSPRAHHPHDIFHALGMIATALHLPLNELANSTANFDHPLLPLSLMVSHLSRLISMTSDIGQLRLRHDPCGASRNQSGKIHNAVHLFPHHH